MSNVQKCTLCGEVKPYTEFYKDSRSSTGISSRCKKCYNEKYLHKKNELSEPKESQVVFMVHGFDLHAITAKLIKTALRYYASQPVSFIAGKMGLTEKALQRRIAYYNIDVKKEKNNAENDIKEKSKLDDYEPRELLKSLYDRGYDGHFFVYVKQEMSLSKLFGEKQ